jgi:diphosphomevalonate decarboxylase
MTRATAHTNIALVKYWGKRPDEGADLNLPAVGSLSMTLAAYRTVTEVRPADADAFSLDGVELTGPPAGRIARHLDRTWALADGGATPRPSCAVHSVNHVPTAAGLASSASGFAALTLAAATAFTDGAAPPREQLSALARRGSGSAARSLWGGFVRLDRGDAADGSDCVAGPVAPQDHWDVKLLIVHTATGAKKVGSTGGMEQCRKTSPYYDSWVASSQRDLEDATAYLQARNLSGLGAVMEHSCFKMHASMWAARPPLIYWNGVTLEVLGEVQRAREEGLTGWATSDAGPHVKVLCESSAAPRLMGRLRDVPGVVAVESLGVGPDPVVEVVQ